MKNLLHFCLIALPLLAGCSTAVNTKDVTKVVVTQTGIRIGQNQADKTPELLLGRSQVEYIKVPTGLNATNTTSGDSAASSTPVVVSSYELNGHSPVFGNAAMTTTFAVGTEGANTTVGGQHQPINTSTGTNSVTIVPAALTPASPTK